MSFNFNISSSGLIAAQRGLKVTQQNISNLNTVGYARQVLELKEAGGVSGQGKGNVAGEGVRLEGIKMITDQILNNNFNNQQSNVSYYQGLQGVLTEIETVFGENTSGGLSGTIESFFESWEEFSKFPEENSYRLALLGEAQKLVQKINTMGSELGRIKNDTFVKATQQVDQVNAVLSNLKEINKQINSSGMDVPNTLLMERDRALQELSSYMKIDVSFESSNPHAVTVRSSGSYLVDKEKYYAISLVSTDKELYLSNGQNRMDITSGQIKSSLDAVNKFINGYDSQLNTFALSLRDEMNAIHRTGFSISGETGLDFFTGNHSKNIAVNSLVSSNPNNIASSSVLGVEGNSEIAKAISKVINKDVTAGINFRNYIGGFNMVIAQDLNTVNTQVAVQSEMLSEIAEQKNNLQGVNLEEEMMNLMMFQKSYQANAKAITIGNQVFDTLFEVF